MESIIINFGKKQKLPEGYRVEFSIGNEHYYWVLDDNTYSIPFATRWDAYRSAWLHYRKNKKK